MKKVLFVFATFALAFASAAEKNYSLTLSEPASLAGTQLKPGDYKIHVEGDKAVLKMGKTVISVPTKVQNADRKFDGTQVSIDSRSGQPKINEIRIGGTTMKLEFSTGTAAGQE